MTTFFVQNDEFFTQMMIFFTQTPFYERENLSFDDFLMTTWEQENERKKEPEILRLSVGSTKSSQMCVKMNYSSQK